jgi:hypothetical protein
MKSKIILLMYTTTAFIISQYLLTNAILPSFFTISSSFLDSLNPLDAIAISVYIGLFVTMLSFLLSSLLTIKRIYLITALASFLIAFITSIALIIIISYLYVTFNTTLLDEIEILDEILRLHIMPVIVVIIFNNVKEFWFYSSLLMFIIYSITIIMMVKERK